MKLLKIVIIILLVIKCFTKILICQDDPTVFMVLKKPNSYYTYSHRYTYLEANYHKGLPIGIWKFYKLDYQEKPDGSADLSSAKKGKLLYTETYKDGELVERKFVDKEIDELN